jgi:hypothetical protein
MAHTASPKQLSTAPAIVTAVHRPADQTATPAATANSNVSPRVMTAWGGIGAVAMSGWGWFVSAELTAERA